MYGEVIFISTFSLFHFFRNSQHPEKRSVSFKNFFRKFEWIRSCYLPIFSNLLKKSLRKTLLFVLNVTSVLEKHFLLVAYLRIIRNTSEQIFTVQFYSVAPQLLFQPSKTSVKSIHKIVLVSL